MRRGGTLRRHIDVWAMGLIETGAAIPDAVSGHPPRAESLA